MKHVLVFVIVVAALLCFVGIVNAEPTGCYIYVSNYYSDSISVISPVTLQKVIDIKTDSKPSDIIINPSGTYLYVAYDGSPYVDVYSCVDYSLVDRIRVSNNNTVQATRMCMNPDGTRLYLSMVSDGSVYSVDITNNVVLAQKFFSGLSLASAQPYGIVYYNGYLYVNMYADNYVVRLDPETLVVAKTYGTPDFLSNYEFNAPMDIVADSFNNRVLVNNINATTTIINVGADSVSGLLTGTTMGNNGNGITVNSTGYAYRSDSGAANISIFNATALVGYINIPGTKPLGIVSNNFNSTVFVADYNNGRLYVINQTNNVLGYIEVGHGAYRVAIGTQANVIQHQVKFVVQSQFGIFKYEDVIVTVYDNMGLLQYSQKTDTSGQVAFYLQPTIRYTVWANKTSENINETMVIVPFEDTYYFKVWSFFTGWNPFGWIQNNNGTGGSWDVNKDIRMNYSVDTASNPRVILLNYSDVTESTTAINFTLLRFWQENGTYTVYNTTLVAGSGMGFQQMPISVLEDDADGQSYQIVVTSTTGAYGIVKRMDSYHFPGVAYPLPGLPAEWYPLVAFGVIVMFGLFFTYLSSGLGLIVMAFWGIVFMFMGWLAWSDTFLLLLQVLAIFGVGQIFKMKRQREGV